MNVNDLQPFASTDEIDEYNTDSRYGGGKYFKITNIPSYIVYSIIRDCIGDAGEEGDNDYEWYFNIKVGEFRFFLYEKDEFTAEFSVEQKGKEQNEKAINQVAKQFIELLSKQSGKYNARMKAAALKATGYVLSNPYATYFGDAEKLMKEAEELERKIARQENAGFPDNEPFEVWHEKHTKNKELQPALCRSAFFMFVASFEGFLNLLYELYLKTSLRDERISGKLAREQVDIKLRLAPIYCQCFKTSEITFNGDEFHRFQYIVKLRNDFIHANLTSSMKIPYTSVDDYTFAIPIEKTGKYDLPFSLTNINTGHLNFVASTIKEVVQSVISSMLPRYKHEILQVLEYDEIYIKVLDDEYIILTP